MEPAFPSLTPTWHNDTYPAINPALAGLSHEGRTVIVTGAGSGIGRATALAYAQAGASHIALVGRTESTLRETEALISSAAKNVLVSVFVGSVTDEAAMKKVAREMGTWHVLVLNAAHLTAPVGIVEVEVDEFWRAYETNVKSIVIAAQTFIPIAQPNATILTVGAAGSIFPPAFTGLSSYMSSKVAQAKLVEYLAAENPSIFICTVHPGVVETMMLEKSALEGLPMDTVELPAHFMVWLSHGEKTRFLSGRFVWVNWDVDELLGLKEEIVGGGILTVGLVGWPFAKEKEKVKEGKV